MHELSLCFALLEQVETLAAQHRAIRVERIVVQLGPLSGIEPSLLTTAWPIAAANSLAATAVLDIMISSVRVYCHDCGAESDVTANNLCCGVCHSYHTQVRSGDELLLAQLELTLE